MRCLLPFLVWLAASLAVAAELTLNESDLDWLAERIFQNECDGRRACLVHWNEGEAFPSLGIGHFIWYPAGVEGPFTESFPALVDFLTERGEAPPAWLASLSPPDAPWPDRSAFVAAAESEDVEALRTWLAQTRAGQARFILARAERALDDVVEAAPTNERDAVRARLDALLATPGGSYAVIDYVNFKGEGLAAEERYQGEGWGLLQVLRAMAQAEGDTALARFRQAADAVLTRRAENAAEPIERERWLPGWRRRLETYREPGR